MRTLVFVHGRGQQGHEPSTLRQRWAAGLNKGLTTAGRDTMDSAAIDAIRFPFYGDVLWAAVVQSRAAVPDVAALDAVQQVDPGLPDAVNRRQVAVLQAMAAELGPQPDVVPEAAFAVPSSVLLRALLEWVANHSGVDEAVIRSFLRDVSAYLELPGCRTAVQEVVRPALLADPDWVLVGHSLGAVVCAELLAEEEVRARVGLFVAIGRLWAWMRSPTGCGPGARPGRPRPGSMCTTPGTGSRWAHRCCRPVGCASSWPSPTPAPTSTPSSTTSPIPKLPPPSPTPWTDRTDLGTRRPTTRRGLSPTTELQSTGYNRWTVRRDGDPLTDGAAWLAAGLFLIGPPLRRQVGDQGSNSPRVRAASAAPTRSSVPSRLRYPAAWPP
jgi:hypothetical protein